MRKNQRRGTGLAAKLHPPERKRPRPAALVRGRTRPGENQLHELPQRSRVDGTRKPQGRAIQRRPKTKRQPGSDSEVQGKVREVSAEAGGAEHRAEGQNCAAIQAARRQPLFHAGLPQI